MTHTSAAPLSAEERVRAIATRLAATSDGLVEFLPDGPAQVKQAVYDLVYDDLPYLVAEFQRREQQWQKKWQATIDLRGDAVLEIGQLETRIAELESALLAARADADALRAEADARFAIYGRLLRGIQRTINGDDVQDHQLRAAIRALIGKMADEFAAMQPWDPDAPKIVQSAALAATPEEK